MTTIIGSILLALLSVQNALATNISLHASSIDGKELKAAGIGQPFIIEAALSDAPSQVQEPEIKVSDQIELRNIGYSMKSINGHSSIVYKYRVRINAQGTHTIGPAVVEVEGKSIKSEPIQIQVTQDQQLEQVKKDDESVVLLRLTCDKQEVSIGQKVQCTLRFFAQNNKANILQVLEPDAKDCKGFTSKEKQGPSYGTQTLNGKLYQYIQWQWYIYPTKAGTCIIPAYAADYTIRSDRTDFLFGFFQSTNAQAN